MKEALGILAAAHGLLSAQAAIFPLDIHLSGANERPTPVVTSATGGELLDSSHPSMSLNTITHQLTLNYAWGTDNGFGDLQSAFLSTHIHAPADVNTSAPVFYALDGFANQPSSFNGAVFAVLQIVAMTRGGNPYSVAAQEEDLLNGLWYADVHSTLYPGGEIRGQLIPSHLVAGVTGGGVVCKNPDQTIYALNLGVTLTAMPYPGWAFANWSGDASGTQNPLSLTMTNEILITANFTSTVPDIIVDNPAATFTGAWATGTGNGCYGPDYRYREANFSGDATFTPTIVIGGYYDVYVRLPNTGNWAPYYTATINFDGGTNTVSLYGVSPVPAGTWGRVPSTYRFAQGTTGSVTLWGFCPGCPFPDSGYVVYADAVRFVWSADQGAPPSGLISWWQGEGDGHDIIGANNGTLVNGPGFTPGKVGQGFNFTAVNQDVLIPASTSLNVGQGSGFSIEAWVNPNDAVTTYPLVEWNDSGSIGAHLWISVAVQGAGSLFANVRDTAFNAHYISSAGGIVQADVWQHVALTYDKVSGVGKVFLNGTAVASESIGTVTTLTSYPLHLGYRPGSGALSGALDEVSLYDRALSDSEILGIYNRGTLGKHLVPCLKIIDINKTAGNASLTWLAESGRTYRVQYKARLDASTWSNLNGDVTASANTASKVDSSFDNAPHRFYRVLLLP